MNFRSSVDLPDEKREELIKLLNQLLATSVDLFTQAKQAHWNVKGRHFISAHELFDDIAKHASHHSDELAERIATLGGYARGTARQAAAQTALEEFAPDSLSGQACLEALVDRLATEASALREGIERSAGDLADPVTEDLLIEVLRQTEFDMWFLESHLEDPRRSFRPAHEAGAPAQPS